MISQRKYITTVVLLVALAAGTFWGGMKYGRQGYEFKGKDFKIVNQNDYPKEVNYGLLWQTLETLNQKYIDKPIDQQKVLYGAIAGAVSAVGDPYTTFFTPKQFADFKTELQGSFDGIGAEVGMKDGAVTIIAPLDDSPAKKAGIMAGDMLLKIDTEDATTMTLDEAVSKIRGPRGTKVNLSIYRPASKKQLDFTITRAKIEVTSVKYSVKEVNGKKIEYINVQRFGDDTLNLFREAANDALKNNVQGIILDLRDDPGGYLDSAVALSSYWVKSGDVVVSEQHSDGSKKDFKATGNNVLGKIPTIIMINGGSASASEIVTGALHDHNLAKTLGTKSFGKGSVQELVNLPQDTALKVTVAKWLTPNGININKNGLEPDVKLDRSPEDIQNNKDPQLDKALEMLTK